MKTRCIFGAIVLLAGCRQSAEQTPQSNEVTPTAEPASTPPPAAPVSNPTPEEAQPPAPGTSGGLPDDRTPLAESNGPIDPKSAEAAGQVVQHYGALIEQSRFEQSRFADAEKLWGDPATAAAFTAQLRRYSAAHLQVGKPHDMEGAAGSSYISVPVVLYGTLKAGGSASRRGEAILRRVNDVPGSTAAQRRWHFERIEWQSA